MDTKYGIRATAASVTGARHLRIARNGQDAAAAWTGDGIAAAVVCDGCGSGHSSEVGARLGAHLAIRALAMRANAGERGIALWNAVRGDLTRALWGVLEQTPGDRVIAIREYFLFTLVGAVITRDEAVVWMIGDGAYAIGSRTRVVGPFVDNEPPYLAYDLLGDPQPAHIETSPPASIVIATDGAAELPSLDRFATARFADHPDALRRHLAVLARSGERIEWEERRVVRSAAVLQDDCAIGVLLPEES
jgi:hypothetical protein